MVSELLLATHQSRGAELSRILALAGFATENLRERVCGELHDEEERPQAEKTMREKEEAAPVSANRFATGEGGWSVTD